MKTSFKRFAALALAAVMVLGTMNLAAFADEGNTVTGTGTRVKDGGLVISGLQEGDVVRFYKVLEETQTSWDYNQTGWIYTSNFVDMSSTATTGHYNMPVSTLIGDSSNYQVNADAVGDIARLIAIKSEAYKYMAVADDTGKASVSPVETGMYVAIINPIDKNIVYNPVIVSCDYVSTNPSASWEVTESATYSDTGAAKKSVITIEKSAETTEHQKDDGKPTTTAIGDSVSFTVDTTVPGYGDVYITPSFVMTDKLTGLELDQNSVKVKDVTTNTDLTGDSTVDIKADQTAKQYKIETTASGYTITFTEKYLTGLTAPHDIQVTYDATVTNEAALNVNVENNTVDIKYTTNPTHSDDHDSKTSPKSEDFSVKFDETNHYTFTIDSSALYNLSNSETIGKSTSELVKVGLNPDGTTRIETSTTTSQITTTSSEAGALQGATFRLYRDSACTEEYIPKNTSGDPIASSAGTAATLYTSGADGRFTIKGLDAGEYWLKEIDAPAGFIKAQNAIPIQIIADIDNDATVTRWYFGGTWYDTKAEAEAKAIAAGYLNNDPDVIPRSQSTTKDGLYVCDMVKEYTATVPVLKSYKIIINGQQASEHTFVHASNSSVIKWSESSINTSEDPFAIENRQGVELPSTGGIGTTIFYAGGAMLVLLAGVLLVSKRRIA